ncbi:3' terminal RNA ribose 2'-O-methyltransferase Hen1 [Aeromicrobium sp. Marseille-Q0843]|uniref:Small RNA 2'-O-methyltransferase n=1 Tax=Aeromicrobium phoceense TaxID=2754045 RepID=A0A838XH92_9ACTN|nr:3' terminal RNA ribose 2'-O-methyltransferase Hen1 [Aeromicrobium phoceense]
MLLTITATRSETLADASDLGYLLHKHPDRVQTFDVYGGTATVLYPEVSPERCTVALVLEVDPIGLVRGRRGRNEGFSLAQYVNDRPYAATSLLSVAMGKVFRSALNGQCKPRPELVDQPLDLRIEVPTMPGGVDLVTRMFEPLGWTVAAEPIMLDPEIPAWGDSDFCAVTLTGSFTLSEALNHLYVLVPVLDGGKHYWVSSDEVDKLVRAGTGWLATHPERELISRRYLARQRDMVDEVRERLDELDGSTEPTVPTEEGEPPLVRLRHDAVIEQVERLRPGSVLDLGCGQGALLRRLLETQGVERVVGTEVSASSLDVASKRLHVDRMTERQADRLDLWLSSLQYQDSRLVGFDLAVLMEVVEHVDEDRLPAVVANVFGFMRPGSVVVTTPNSEYNALYPALAAGGFRHVDHRFEWSRGEFAAWSDGVAARYGYTVECSGVGAEDPERGTPTQLAVFRRAEEVAA